MRVSGRAFKKTPYASDLARPSWSLHPSGRVVWFADGSNFPFQTNITREREGAVFLDATDPFMGKPSYAIHMKTLISMMELYKDFGAWSISRKVGFEIWFKGNTYFYMGIELRDNPDLDQYIVGFIGDEIMIRDGGSAFTTIDSAGNVTRLVWTNVKLIVDLGADAYVKLYAGRNVYDLSARTPYVSWSGDRKTLRVFCYTAQANPANVAGCIVTDELEES